MEGEAAEYVKRFDDVYRVLLVIGPILSFSFSNYSTSPSASNFIYYVGFPALISSILLWTVGHLLYRKWEFELKLMGYILIWFASLSVFSIVYVKGSNGHIAWVLLAVLGTLLIVQRTARNLAGYAVISPRFVRLAIVVTISIDLISAPFIFL